MKKPQLVYVVVDAQNHDLRGVYTEWSRASREAMDICRDYIEDYNESHSKPLSPRTRIEECEFSWNYTQYEVKGKKIAQIYAERVEERQ